MAGQVSISEAAARLGVNRARVHQLVTKGELPAQRIGGRWLLDAGAVATRERDGVPAHRPFSSRAAWGLLSLAAGGGAPWLSPSEKSRARHRLRTLPAEEWAWMCRRRAIAHRFFAHPSALPRILADPRCVRGGVSALDTNGADLLVVGKDEAEVYAVSEDLATLVRAYALSDSDRPNLVVRIPSEVWPFEDGAEVAPPAVVALDLIDAGDERSRRAGTALLEDELRHARADATRASRR